MCTFTDSEILNLSTIENKSIVYNSSVHIYYMAFIIKGAHQWGNWKSNLYLFPVV